MNKLNIFLKKNIFARPGLKFNSTLISIINKKFASGHGPNADHASEGGDHDAHGHGHHVEEDYHVKHFNRVSYNKKLSNAEREKIPFIDYLNDPDTDWIKPRFNFHNPLKRYEVLVPYERIAQDRESILLDRTEIQARIYNLLRQFDFKPLEEIDFDGDYEKDLGLDSLEWTALVTSIEHEFNTAFEDTLYDHFRTINDFVKLIEKDYACF
jgi:acyl carrier protein